MYWTKVSFFVPCTKMQLITLYNFNTQTYFSQFLSYLQLYFFELSLWIKQSRFILMFTISTARFELPHHPCTLACACFGYGSVFDLEKLWKCEIWKQNYKFWKTLAIIVHSADKKKEIDRCSIPILNPVMCPYSWKTAILDFYFPPFFSFLQGS